MKTPLMEKEFVSVLITGLSELEVGVLPPTADDILMGTMQRTRSGQVRAAVVIGANEGVLPSGAPEEGLFQPGRTGLSDRIGQGDL